MLERETAREWSHDLADMANKAESLAGRLEVFPGGDLAAAALREAARCADFARKYLEPTAQGGEPAPEVDGTRAGADMH